MNILIDKDNLITSFAEVGGFEGGIEIDNSILPEMFVQEFKSGKFKYSDGAISYNKDFVDGEAYSQIKSENVTLESKVKTLEDRVKELEDIIANNQVPE